MSYVITINGSPYETSEKKSLLRYLRDDLHLTSVKDGCSQGACGACTVLVDGKPSRACVLNTSRLHGKSIVTVEGLSSWEKLVYTYAYGHAGAVQCGFCIPGMVLCSKALLDQNADPTDGEIRNALRNNYCRCTGYVKIIDAVKLAAQIFVRIICPTVLSVGMWAHGYTGGMQKRKYLAPAFLPMTSIWMECSMPAPCAAATQGRGYYPSIRRRQQLCPE